MNRIEQAYALAKERYAEMGIDTDAAIARLETIPLSLHCWQGDDVKGFLFRDQNLTGGIQVTGNHPGAARNPEELRRDLDEALRLIAGQHKVNLHAIYADTDEKIDLDEIEPRHYSGWMDWAEERGLGLDFNPTCFSHPKSDSGFTLSSGDEGIRSFWVEHCRRSRKVGEAFGKRLGKTCVTNVWIPDGYKDIPVDRLAPRERLLRSLDEVFAEPLDKAANLDAVESKVFGIGSEAYVTGSHEFYMGYATTRGTALALDTGHFHPTEVVSNKLSALMLFSPSLLLHISRPMRWDSDHVVILDDELREIALELVRNDILDRTHIGLDYFDGSINRIAAWVIGMHNMQKALLYALLEPSAAMKKLEQEGDYTLRLAYLEECKSLPWTAVWDYFCLKNGVPTGDGWIAEVKRYEDTVLAERG